MLCASYAESKIALVCKRLYFQLLIYKYNKYIVSINTSHKLKVLSNNIIIIKAEKFADSTFQNFEKSNDLYWPIADSCCNALTTIIELTAIILTKKI